MGVYWLIANHTKKQRLALERIGGGGNKAHNVSRGPAGLIMASLMTHEWMGDHITVEPDSDMGRYDEVERTYEDVTERVLAIFNECEKLCGREPIALHGPELPVKERPPADMAPTGPAQVIVHTDIRYAVVMTPYSHHVAFTAYLIEGFADDAHLYWEKGSPSNFPGTQDVANAEPFCEGAVKWDGCSNLSFDGNIHLCGYDMAGAVGTLLKRIYERAKEMMPEHADFSIDEGDPHSG